MNMEPRTSSAWEVWKPRVRPLFDLVFPRSCSLCNRTIIEASREALCDRCDAALIATDPACLRCSAPVNALLSVSEKRKKKCTYCERRRWYFRRAYCYTVYSETAAKAAKKMKLPNHEPLAIELGIRLANWMFENHAATLGQYQYVIPIPQHWVRRMTIRYNQAEVLAEQVAKILQVPLRRRWLYRTRLTEKQGTKSLQQRLHSLDESFSCRGRDSIRGARVLLVDDIVTSGATASDAARAIRVAGARSVDVLAFARGVGAITRNEAPKLNTE